MALIRIERHPSRRQLGVFGLLWLAAFGLLGWIVARRTGSTAAAGALWAAAVLAPLVGWLYPPFLRLLYLGLAYAAFPIGWVVSHLVLGLVYYAVLTPIGLVMRLMGRDSMRRAFDPAARSYWSAHRQAEQSERYLRQF